MRYVVGQALRKPAKSLFTFAFNLSNPVEDSLVGEKINS